MKLDGAQLATIRELLSDAFNSGEIDTLAFDLFQSVYRDFSPAMTRSTKIRSIVEHANDNGLIRDLLFYAERENPYQYSLYAAKLTSVWQKLDSTTSTEEARPRTDTGQEKEAKDRKQRLSGEENDSQRQSESHSSPGTSATTHVTTDQSVTITPASTSTQSGVTRESPPATVPQPAATPASNVQRPASENDSRLLISAVIAVLAIMVVSAAVLRYILNVTEVSSLILLLLIELPFVLVIIGKITGQDFLSWLRELVIGE